LPVPHEWVDEENVPRERHHRHLSAVRVLQVHGTVLDIITRPKKKFSLTVELQGVRWLIHFVCSFQILCSSLLQFGFSGINNLMKIMHLSEPSGALRTKKELV